MALKMNTSVNKEPDMDKSSVVCSSAEGGTIVVEGDDWTEGFSDLGEMNRTPMFQIISMMSPFKPMNKA